jgi:hypothetical protein
MPHIVRPGIRMVSCFIAASHVGQKCFLSTPDTAACDLSFILIAILNL